MPPGDPPTTPPGEPPGTPPPARCAAPNKTGVRCIATVRPGKTYCYNHDPAFADERARAGAIRRQPGDLGTELGTLDGIARRVAKVLDELELAVPLGETNEERRERRREEKAAKAAGKKPRVAVGVCVYALEPGRANAKLNTLRLLAALVIKRTDGSKRKAGDASGAPEKPYSLEDIA